MAEQNPVIQRLKEQKERSEGMVPSWLRSAAGSQTVSDGTVPPAAFPSPARYRLAAQSMLTLGENKPGILHLDLLSGFTRSVSQKYEEARSLARFFPKIDRETGTWGEMDRIFPNLATGKGGESPPSGEMRRGTLIQKFDMFPKPGQPLASFKRQSEQTPIQKRMKEAEARKRPPTPGQRLFSHVTEITPGKKPEADLLDDTAEEFEAHEERPQPVAPIPYNRVPEDQAEYTPFERTPEDLPEPAPQNRIPDILPEPVPPPVETRLPQELPAEPPVTKPADSLPLVGRPNEGMPPAFKAGNDGQDGPRESKSAVPLPVSQVSGELPKALPVKKAAVRQAEILKALPSNPRQEMVKPAIARPSSTGKTVQRAPDHIPAPKPAESHPAAQQGQVRNIPQPPPSTMEAPPSAQAAPESDPIQYFSPDQSNPVMDGALAPMQKLIEHHRMSGEGLTRSFSPDQIKQTLPHPFLNRPYLPLLAPGKYRFEQDASGRTGRGEKPIQAPTFAEPVRANKEMNQDLFPLKNPAEWDRRQQTSPRREESPPVLPQQVVDEQPFELVYPKLPNQPDQDSGKDTSRGTPSAAPASKPIVQRENDTTAPPSSPPMDLISLADDVFPYVKRMLEIERERTRGSLR